MITRIPDYNLLPMNTFRMNVSCRQFVEYTEADDIPAIVSQLGTDRFKHIGAGSNLQFTGVFPGTVLHSRILDVSSRSNPDGSVSVRVGAGVVMDEFIAQTAANGLWGLENLSGIPGEVGSSAVQNVGAYGVEAGDLIESVEAYDCVDRKWVAFDREACLFGYRDSFFKHSENFGRYIISYVTFRLSSNGQPKLDYGNLRQSLPVDADKATPMDIRQTVIRVRNTKLPPVEEVGSAGSFFKNPVVEKDVFESVCRVARSEHGEDFLPPHYVVGDRVKIPAAWLIDQCGLKGLELGNAAVWKSQPLVIVNATGKASPGEIIALERHIIESVNNKFNIRLHPEVEHIG